MKYHKTSKFTKAITSTGFFAVIACTLIAIGAISWFLLSEQNNITETPSETPSLQSYPDLDNSYDSLTEDEEQIDETTDANDTVSDVPYTDEQPQSKESQESNTSQVTPSQEQEKPSFVLPIIGNISKGYSDTALQYSATYGDMRLHTGVDILCDKGSNIKSAGSGTVKSVVEDATLGRVIAIEYLDNILVKYCGFGSVNVKEGDKVATGDIIGTTGEIPSECADNPHIHIEVFIDGKSISPLAALGLE